MENVIYVFGSNYFMNMTNKKKTSKWFSPTTRFTFCEHRLRVGIFKYFNINKINHTAATCDEKKL